MVSPQARREQVGFACEHGLSERRACGLLGIARSTLSYELTLPAKDAPVIAAMRTLSAQYPRYGYRRIRIFLRRQGHQLGVHRTHRLWRQAGLQLPRRRPRRRIATGRPRPLPATNANFVWAYDFVFDATAQGQQIKCLTVVDEFTHECLAIRVSRRLKSIDVIDALSDLFILRGVPGHVRSDNGPEFVARAVQEWIAAVGAKTAYIQPGSHWENGYVESFNARLRDELLDGEIFYTLCEAKIVIESWRRHYNAIRPHASLGYRAPAPEVFVPVLAAWPPAQLQSAAPATLLLHMRPNLN